MFSIGVISASIIPIVSVISCGDKASTAQTTKPSEYKDDKAVDEWWKNTPNQTETMVGMEAGAIVGVAHAVFPLLKVDGEVWHIGDKNPRVVIITKADGTKDTYLISSSIPHASANVYGYVKNGKIIGQDPFTIALEEAMKHQ